MKAGEARDQAAARRRWRILGASGGGLSVLCASLFIFRAESEPVVGLVVPILVGQHGYFRYQASDFSFWAGLVGFLALSSIGLSVWAARRRPAGSKRIDAALWSRIQSSHSTSLEPRQSSIRDPKLLSSADLTAISKRRADTRRKDMRAPRAGPAFRQMIATEAQPRSLAQGGTAPEGTTDA